MADAQNAASARRQKLIGILCVVGAISIFSVQDMTFKWLSDRYPLHELVFIRGVIAMAVVLAILVPLENGYRALINERIPLHLLRGLAIVIGNMAFFAGIASLPLAEGVAIFFTAPLIITLISIPLLGEKVGLLRLGAVMTGLAGAFIVIRPGTDAFQVAALLPLVAACAYSAMTIMTRKIGMKDSASTMAFYLQVMFIAGSMCFWLVAGDGRYAGSENASLEFLLRAWVWPHSDDVLIIIAIGVMNAFGGYLISQGYRLAEASAAAPFEYVAVPLAVLWGVLVWGELPDAIAMVGIVLIVAAGVFVAVREMWADQN